MDATLGDPGDGHRSPTHYDSLLANSLALPRGAAVVTALIGWQLIRPRPHIAPLTRLKVNRYSSTSDRSVDV
tara:strand:+ start:3103 stop:3318 length:216 start_codon:yes stop_codon:yes gene_type:complete